MGGFVLSALILVSGLDLRDRDRERREASGSGQQVSHQIGALVRELQATNKNLADLTKELRGLHREVRAMQGRQDDTEFEVEKFRAWSKKLVEWLENNRRQSQVPPGTHRRP